MTDKIDKKYAKQWFIASSILLLIGMEAAHDVYLDYRKTESVEDDRLQVQARVIDENLNHQLVATYESLQRIIRDLPYWRVGTSYRPVANLMLKTIEEAMPGVRTLLILDAKGIVRASSRPELIGRELKQRDFFQAVRRQGDPALLYLSPPYTTILNVYAMNVTRVIPGLKGEFNGIIAATLDPEYFKTLLASVQYAPDMWVAMAHGDGIQFLMVPDREGQSGKNLAQSGSFFTRHRDSGRKESIMTGTVYATGEKRVMALRTIRPAGAHLDKPLVVAVGRDIHALFSGWRRNATIYGSVYFAIVLITVFSLRYNQRSVRRAEERVRQSKAALEESEGKYKFLIEATSTGYVIIDMQGRVIEANQEYVRMAGHDRLEDIAGRPVTEWTAEHDLARNAEEVKKCLQRGFTRNLIIDYADGQGRTTPIEINATVLPGPPAARIFTICRDITERKRAEETIKQSEKKLRDITASLGEGLYVLSERGEITFMNPEAERLLGWTEAELMGKNSHDLIHCQKSNGTPLPYDQCPMHNAMHLGIRYTSHDQVFVRKDGSVFPISVISAPLQKNDAATASVTVFRDISDLKRAERDRDKLIAELQKALAEIRTLHGILPICASCKKIRDDKGAWTQMETYITAHTDAEFSHGICSECAKRLYPEYYKEPK